MPVSMFGQRFDTPFAEGVSAGFVRHHAGNLRIGFANITKGLQIKHE
jgi:hypothetical protein